MTGDRPDVGVSMTCDEQWLWLEQILLVSTSLVFISLKFKPACCCISFLILLASFRWSYFILYVLSPTVILVDICFSRRAYLNFSSITVASVFSPKKLLLTHLSFMDLILSTIFLALILCDFFTFYPDSFVFGSIKWWL